MMTDSKSDEPEDLIEPLPGNKSLSNLQKFTTTVEPSVCGHFRGKMKFLLENFPPLVLWYIRHIAQVQLYLTNTVLLCFSANDTLLMRSCAHTRLWKEAGHYLKAVSELNVNNDFVHIPKKKIRSKIVWIYLNLVSDSLLFLNKSSIFDASMYSPHIGVNRNRFQFPEI